MRRMEETMTIEEFDAAIRMASRDVNFGPMNGFAGRGSEDVIANLPDAVRVLLLERWKLPRAIIQQVGSDIRCYAAACGYDVATDLEKLPTDQCSI